MSDERNDKIEKAFQEVFKLCRGKRFEMTIPVQETDSDCVIVAGLKVCEEALTELSAVKAERDAQREALRGLLQTIDRATNLNLHHHMCPKWAALGGTCKCGADEFIKKARVADSKEIRA